MARSRTRKSRITNGQVVEAIVAVEAATEYVKSWTKTEAKKLLKSDPIIITAKWGLQVGKYKIKFENLVWNVYNEFDEVDNSFTSKKSATVYSLLTHTGRHNQARNLWLQDMKLSKLEQDKINYTYNKTHAIKRKDMFTVDVITARLTDNAIMLENAKIDLEKTLNQAKYLKGIWE
jgi:hypothetical protein